MRALRNRGKALGVVAALAGLIAYAAVAFADQIDNEIVTDHTGTTVTVAPGATVDVKFWISATNSGGLSGCDASDGSNVTVTIPTVAGVTIAKSDGTPLAGAGQNQLVFSSCGSSNFQTVRYTPAGGNGTDYTIPNITVWSDSSGHYSSGGSGFNIHVRSAGGSVNNAPVITGHSLSGNCQPTSTFTFTDDAGDTHTGEVDWDKNGTSLVEPAIQLDDGASPPVLINTFAATKAASYSSTHSGDVGDAFDVEAKVTDNGGLSATDTKTHTLKAESGSGILPPVNADGSSVFKLGSGVPLKIKDVADCDGDPQTALTPTVALRRIGTAEGGTVNETVDPVVATNGKTMRYDAANDQYIYNLSTKKSQFGGNDLQAGLYEVTISATNLVPVVVEFTIRK